MTEPLPEGCVAVVATDAPLLPAAQSQQAATTWPGFRGARADGVAAPGTRPR